MGYYRILSWVQFTVLYSKFLLIMLYTVVCMSWFETPNLSLSTFLTGIPKTCFQSLWASFFFGNVHFFFFFFRFRIKVIYALKTILLLLPKMIFYQYSCFTSVRVLRVPYETILKEHCFLNAKGVTILEP